MPTLIQIIISSNAWWINKFNFDMLRLTWSHLLFNIFIVFLTRVFMSHGAAKSLRRHFDYFKSVFHQFKDKFDCLICKKHYLHLPPLITQSMLLNRITTFNYSIYLNYSFNMPIFGFCNYTCNYIYSSKLFNISNILTYFQYR